MSRISNSIIQIAIGCIFLFTLACERPLPPPRVQEHLKSAWLTYLHRQPTYDSTKVSFQIVDVAYFEDTTYYICNFKVRMKVPSRNLDTVGTMSGYVSKDFKVVHRRS